MLNISFFSVYLCITNIKRMDRKVFIIGSPLAKSNTIFYSGVKRDVENFYSFFTSPTGGGYRDNEIIYLENPSKYDIILYLNSAPSDFVTTVFSGHGFTQNKTTYLDINSQESISLRNIVTNIRADRKLILTDICRSYKRSDFSHFLGDPSSMHFESNLSNRDARTLFENSLLDTNPGLQIIYSCSEGESSTITENGSYFSNALLTGIQNWSSCIKNGSILLGEGAFKCSSYHLKRNPKAKQIPQRGSTSLNANYPFAVRFGLELY